MLFQFVTEYRIFIDATYYCILLNPCKKYQHRQLCALRKNLNVVEMLLFTHLFCGWLKQKWLPHENICFSYPCATCVSTDTGVFNWKSVTVQINLTSNCWSVTAVTSCAKKTTRIVKAKYCKRTIFYLSHVDNVTLVLHLSLDTNIFEGWENTRCLPGSNFYLTNNIFIQYN